MKVTILSLSAKLLSFSSYWLRIQVEKRCIYLIPKIDHIEFSMAYTTIFFSTYTVYSYF